MGGLLTMMFRMAIIFIEYKQQQLDINSQRLQADFLLHSIIIRINALDTSLSVFVIHIMC